MNPSWDMQSFVLQMRILEESHTGENIAEVLQESLLEWELDHSHVALVTDNAVNMGVAARAAGLESHIRCFALILNVACQNNLKISSVDRVLGKLQRIVTCFQGVQQPELCLYF